MTVSYTPGFTHTDWVDNQDRVQAAGGNGFNGRFHAIEAEFAALQIVVQDISNALVALNVTRPPQTVISTLTPTLVLVGVPSVNTHQWLHGEGYAFLLSGQMADGMMDVQLPDGSTINTLRVIGSKGSNVIPTGSGVLTVTLYRQPTALASSFEPVAVVSIADAQVGDFDEPRRPISQAVAKVATQQFRYFLVARLDAAAGTGAGAPGVRIDAFAIAHTG